MWNKKKKKKLKHTHSFLLFTLYSFTFKSRLHVETPAKDFDKTRAWQIALYDVKITIHWDHWLHAGSQVDIITTKSSVLIPDVYCQHIIKDSLKFKLLPPIRVGTWINDFGFYGFSADFQLLDQIGEMKSILFKMITWRITMHLQTQVIYSVYFSDNTGWNLYIN